MSCNLFDFKEKIDDKELKKCAKIIEKGGVGIFPTETVYGIGANALDEMAVNKIFAAKKRPSDNPLIVHISDMNMLNLACDVSKLSNIQKKLIDKFFPGPFTIILPKSKNIPYNVTAGLETVGVRMPDNVIANRLIKFATVPIAAPSANASGKPSGTQVEDIYDELSSSVDFIIDGGRTNIGIESTVVKVDNDKVIILRPGKITVEDLESVVGSGNVLLAPQLFVAPKPNEKVESPGMKHRHYAPKCKCVLVYSDKEKLQIDEVNKLIDDNRTKYSKICILGFNEHIEAFKNVNSKKKNIEYISLGSINNYFEISKNIFTALRKLDRISCDFAIIEAVKKQGIGIGIMNRLIRACEYNEIIVK